MRVLIDEGIDERFRKLIARARLRNSPLRWTGRTEKWRASYGRGDGQIRRFLTVDQGIE
jgi:hypothetical protein